MSALILPGKDALEFQEKLGEVSDRLGLPSDVPPGVYRRDLAVLVQNVVCGIPARDFYDAFAQAAKSGQDALVVFIQNALRRSVSPEALFAAIMNASSSGLSHVVEGTSLVDPGLFNAVMDYATPSVVTDFRHSLEFMTNDDAETLGRERALARQRKAFLDIYKIISQTLARTAILPFGGADTPVQQLQALSRLWYLMDLYVNHPDFFKRLDHVQEGVRLRMELGGFASHVSLGEA